MSVSNDDEIGAILAISITPPTRINPQDIIRKISEAATKTDKPILSVMMGSESLPANESQTSVIEHASYQFPEPGAYSILQMYRYRQWCEKPEGKIKKFKVEKENVAKILDKEGKKAPHYLTNKQVFDILSAYNLPFVESESASSHHAAAKIAEKIGFPVVLKAEAKNLIHKTDIGGVLVDLRNRGEVIDAFYNLKEKVESQNKDSFKGVLVQKMVTKGKEVILGMTSKKMFGPLLLFGLGGIFVEVLKDVQVRPAPITDLDAD